MQEYDLELNILSCLLQKPEFMNELKLEDKHFVKYQRLWQFMKSFYNKYGTFDIVLMCNICTDRKYIMYYIEQMLRTPALPILDLFNLYQDQIIKKFEQDDIDKFIINEVYKMAGDLLLDNISIEEFESRFTQAMEERERVKNQQN